MSRLPFFLFPSGFSFRAPEIFFFVIEVRIFLGSRPSPFFSFSRPPVIELHIDFMVFLVSLFFFFGAPFFIPQNARSFLECRAFQAFFSLQYLGDFYYPVPFPLVPFS